MIATVISRKFKFDPWNKTPLSCSNAAYCSYSKCLCFWFPKCQWAYCLVYPWQCFTFKLSQNFPFSHSLWNPLLSDFLPHRLIQILLCWTELCGEKILIQLQLHVPRFSSDKNRKIVLSTAILKIIPFESYTRKKPNHRGIWYPESPTLDYGQNLESWVTCPGDSLLFVDN